LSKSGIKVIALLVLAIVAVLVLFPAHKSKKPAPTIKTGNAVQQLEVRRQQTKRNVNRAQKRPAKPKKKPVSTASIAAIPEEDFELLSERFGRDDPFSPFFKIPAVSGDQLVDLPDLDPLPPMIIENPSNMTLSAIAVNDKGQGSAVINGEVYHEGDYILGYRVHTITVSRVELVNDLNDMVILPLRQKLIDGFSVTGNSISNITEEDVNQILPLPHRRPVPGMNVIENDQYMPPATGIGPPGHGPAQTAPRPHTSEEFREPDNQGGSSSGAMNDVESILSRPENSPDSSN